MAIVQGLSQELDGQTLLPKLFMNYIRTVFNHCPDIKFRMHRSIRVDVDNAIVSGYYDSDADIAGSPSVEIVISLNPEQAYIKSDNFNWDIFGFDLAECICHELIHKQQFRQGGIFDEYISEKEDHNQKTEQEYLGSEREIDAYAFSIAAEYITFNRPITECTMYRVYQYTFDEDDSVMLKLQEYIVKYLTYLEFDYDQDDSH
jgi:hypothetical protein